MKKPMRKIARISTLTGVALAGFVGLGASAAYADEPIVEVLETNYADGFHITQINEGSNTLKLAWDMEIADWANPEYRLTDYHIFWGEVNNSELSEMLERTDGVTTIAKGSDGATRFANPYEQVEFVAPTGVNLADNSGKILSYVVKMEARRPELTDKIVAGRVDYKRCTDSIGYAADGKIFCARDEYAGGRSFYNAYNADWRKLEPAVEIRYIEKEVPVRASLIATEVPVAERSTGVAFGTNILSVAQRAATGVVEGDGLVAGDANTDNASTDSVNIGNEEAGDDAKEVVEVPELGNNGGNKSYLMWWLGFVALLSIGALGAFSWFFWPILPIHKKKADKKRK